MMYGKVLKIKREAMGLSQNELGAKAKVSGVTISAIENGKEVSELVLQSVKHIMRQLEDEMVENQYNDFKLVIAARFAAEETDPDEKMKKLHNLLFSVTKSINGLEKSKYVR